MRRGSAASYPRAGGGAAAAASAARAQTGGRRRWDGSERVAGAGSERKQIGPKCDHANNSSRRCGRACATAAAAAAAQQVARFSGATLHTVSLPFQAASARRRRHTAETASETATCEKET